MKTYSKKAFLRRLLILCVAGVVVFHARAQHIYQPLNNFRVFESLDSNLSAVQAPSLEFVPQSIDSSAGWAKRKLLSESLIQHQSTNLSLYANLIFNDTGYGRMTADSSLDSLRSSRVDYRFTRGLMVHGVLMNKLKFWTAYTENQAFFPKYLTDHVYANREQVFTNLGYIYDDNKGMIPGQGRAKRFKDSGYDWGWGFAGLELPVADWLKISAGNDKLVIGNGYRSLLLSDNAYNAPGFRFEWTWRKFTYLNGLSSLQSLKRLPIHNPSREERFLRKTQSIHYLEWQPIEKLAVGWFESTIWQTENEAGLVRPNVGMYNPIIGLDLLWTGGWSEVNNTTYGLNLVFNSSVGRFYGQCLIDDIGAAEYGGQLGWAGSVSVGEMVISGNVEYNTLSEGSYKSDTVLQSFDHYNQFRGHAWGGGMSELVVNANARLNRLNMEGFARWGKFDTGEKLNWVKIQLRYALNPTTKMDIFVAYTHRDLTGLTDMSEQILSLGWRTNLWAEYHDL